MNIEEKVRGLAKSQYWQSVYHASKDARGIELFENKSNLSGLQLLFVYWLRIYSLLYEELHGQEWLNLTEEVILDDIHCDAFLYWRSKEIEARTRKHKEEERKTVRANGKKMDEEKTSRIYRGVPKKK